MKNKLRIELVYSKLRELKNSLHYVKEFLPSDYNFLKDRKDKNALYKEVEFAIQLMIDICAIIHSDIGKTTPSDENDIISEIGKVGVLSKGIIEKVLSMKGFRNLLVHRYEKLDDKIAYESIKSGLDDFDIFIEEIEKFLKKHQSQKPI